jgi:hypothetical protein
LLLLLALVLTVGLIVEIYYTTHQFFMSEDAIYIVVCDARVPIEQTRLDYWLASITAKAPDAPIIIVATHRDSSEFQYNDSLQQKLIEIQSRFESAFPSIQHITAVSCVNRLGIDLLKSELVSIAIDRVQSASMLKLPMKFKCLDDCIRFEKQSELIPPILRHHHLMELCDMVRLHDEALIKRATQLLTSLGSIMYNPDIDHDCIIVDPEWLADCMATIITTKQNFVVNGILKQENCIQIWRPPKYPIELHPMLLHLLVQFEVAFLLSGTEQLAAAGMSEHDTGRARVTFDLMATDFVRNRSNADAASNTQVDSNAERNSAAILIPCLLPLQPACERLEQMWPTALANGERQVHRFYKLNYTPVGLFSRFQVRALKFVERAVMYWRTGIVVENGSARARVEQLAIDSGAIGVQIRALQSGFEDMVKLLRIIVQTLDSLCSYWYHMQVQESIPCPHCLKIAASHLANPSAITSSTSNNETSSSSSKYQQEEAAKSLQRIAATLKIDLPRKSVSSEAITMPSTPTARWSLNNVVRSTDSTTAVAATTAATASSASNKESLPFQHSQVHFFSTADCDSAVASQNPVLICPLHGRSSLPVGEVAPDIALADIDGLRIDSASQLQFGADLGVGAFGSVKRAILDRRTAVAVKQLHNLSNEAAVAFRHEVWLMAQLKHTNLVRMYGFSTDPLLIVMEVIEGGDLYSYLHNSNTPKLSWTQRVRLALEIARGMKYLHGITPAIIHRDLKSPNILVCE